jgi:dihydrodipicolinate synthase/N-acetylneuraminate lyase
MARSRIAPDKLTGVWSASPTPFTERMQIDVVSVRRMIDHHLRLGVKKLFLAGTCGEGPWMRNRDRRKLVQTVSQYAGKRMIVAVQVTDNSAARILDVIHEAKEDGAGIAIIASPYFVGPPAPNRIVDIYLRAISESPLPIGLYDRGRASSVFVPNAVLKQIVAQRNVILVKDSSLDPARRAIFLAARRRNPSLRLFTGYEFGCVEYLAAGYDGLLLGGGIFNGYLAAQIIQAAGAGDLSEAERLQRRMNRIMWAAYGGKKLTCWLTGLKTLLVEMGVFRNARGHLTFPMTDNCRRAIKRLLEKDRDVLLP